MPAGRTALATLPTLTASPELWAGRYVAESGGAPHPNAARDGSEGSVDVAHVSPPCVAHSFDVWLPLTMTWAYSQVRFACDTRAVVLAGQTMNRDYFPWDPVYTAGSAWERKWLRAAGRARIRAYPRSYGRAFRCHKPVVLHSHFGYRGWGDLPLAKRFDVVHVVTFYGHDVTMFPRTWPVWRGRYTDLFAAADLILCEGPFMASTLAELGCPPDKVRVQRLGVDLESIPFRRRELQDGDLVRILIAGAFRPKKGIPAALRAVAACRGYARGLEVTVVGGSNGSPVEEAERECIEDTVRSLGIANIVTFLGVVPYERLLAEVERHHVFLSPSITAPDGDCEGGAPVTIIEAAASGMPVVSTTHCDIPETVEDGVTGLLAAEGDQESLNQCLRRVLESPEDWPVMGGAARELARERFDVHVCARHLAEVYREAVALCQS